MFTACGIMHGRCCRPAASSVHYNTSCKHSLVLLSVGEIIARNYRPKQVELIEIINKPLLLHLVGYLCYWQMRFKSVFKGLKTILACLEAELWPLKPMHGLCTLQKSAV